MENIWIDFSLKTYIQMHRKRYSTLSNSEWDANTATLMYEMTMYNCYKGCREVGTLLYCW